MTYSNDDTPIVLRMQFEFPAEARKWLGHHLGKKRATKKDFKQMIAALVGAWESDIASDYEERSPQ